MQTQYNFSLSKLQNWKYWFCPHCKGKKPGHLLPVLPNTVIHFSTMVFVIQSGFKLNKIKIKQIQEWRGKLTITEKDIFPVCHDSHSMNCALTSPSPHWGEITFQTTNGLFKDVLSNQTCVSPTSSFWNQNTKISCIGFLIKFMP